MEMTGIDSQNTVTGCIRKLRRNCSERLARELNLECGHDGLIVRNDRVTNWPRGSMLNLKALPQLTPMSPVTFQRCLKLSPLMSLYCH